MSVQSIAVSAIILAAGIYVAFVLVRRTRAFSVKKNCGTDCGCGEK